MDHNQALSMLSRLSRDIRNRRPEVQRFDEYYRGTRSRLKYASTQFRDYFEKRYEGFTDNWCQVVADAPHERLDVTGIRPSGAVSREADAELWEVWRRNEADFLSPQAFLESTIAKRAYALVWGNDNDQPVITWEHPSQAAVHYDPETGDRRAGLKLWHDEHTGREFATLYTPTEVWKFERKATSSGFPGITEEASWEPRQGESDASWPIPNPLGSVPLVEITNRPRLMGEPMSDIAGATAMQDAINLLWAYLFNAADLRSLPQRVVLGAERPRMPILDENGEVVGDKPVELERFALDRVSWIEDPEAKISEWSSANLDIYTEAMETAVAHLAAQTRTPPHYLMLGKGLVNVSAEGMKVAETGLAQRAQEKTKNYGRGIREVFRLCALVMGNVSKAEAVATGSVLWADVESRSEAQTVDAAAKLRSIGFPLEWIARARLRLPPEEVEEVMQMIRSETEMDPLAVMKASDQMMPEANSGGEQQSESETP